MGYEILNKIQGIKENEPLSKHTQLKVGGPAELYYETNNRQELVIAIKAAHEESIPVTILGWASNTLVSSNGIKGLVIVNKTNNIIIHDREEGEKSIEIVENDEETLARLDQLQPDIYGKFDDLDYDESNLPVTKVYMDSGVPLPLAIYKSIKADLTGLQWFSGIPGTVGGGVYNNIHGGTHFFDEVIESIEVLDKETLEEKTLTIAEIEPDYDYTNLQKTKHYILGVTFKLFNGDSEKAMKVMQEWRQRKKIQPWISMGCSWKNISNEDKERLKVPTTSMGYIIDQILKLKGEMKGDAMISDKHAAFIENKGKASSDDVLFLMKKIYHKAKDELGIDARPEIFFLGFEPEEIKEFIH